MEHVLGQRNDKLTFPDTCIDWSILYIEPVRWGMSRKVLKRTVKKMNCLRRNGSVYRRWVEAARCTAAIRNELRHSLSTWVNNATKDVKVVHTLLRHSNPDITVGTYIHGAPEANLKAREQYGAAMMKGGNSLQTNLQNLMQAKPASDFLQ